MKFKKEYLMEELGLPGGSHSIEDTLVGHSRWSVEHELVFLNRDGKKYRCSYSVGATESQDEMPWEYENEVACEEVVQRTVTVRKWEAV